MLRSIATVSISGTLPEKLHAIAAAGYQGVEIFENDLLYYTGTPADIRHLAADLGLKITLFNHFVILKAPAAPSLPPTWNAPGANLRLCTNWAATPCCCAATFSRTVPPTSSCRSPTYAPLLRWRSRNASRLATRRWPGAPTSTAGIRRGRGSKASIARRWASSRQFPRAGARRYAGAAGGRAAGKNHLCTDGRRAADENGYPRMEPSLPLFSRPGQLPLVEFAQILPAAATAALVAGDL